MEFCFSQKVKDAFDDADALGIGIPLRVHCDQKKERESILRLHNDWSCLVRMLEGYNGALGSPYHFVSVTIPECLPERLPIVAYANEFAFLYDDELEKLDIGGEENEFLGTFQHALHARVEPRSRPEKKIQAWILEEMMAIDAPRATVMMQSWATFVQSTSCVRVKPYELLEEYVPARIIDAGELIWFGFITFGMALSIPSTEYNRCNQLARPAYAALGLTNDLYSWEKEQHESQIAGHDYVFNAIWVIMKERSVSEAEARTICRTEIRKWISTYYQIVEESRVDKSLSKDVRIYLEALLYSYVGNLAWSISCPRYKQF